MSFTAYLRDQADHLWEREHTHPFVVGIGKGTLPIEMFQYYLKQDYIFLVEFSRAIAIAAAKAPSLEDMGKFAELLDETLNNEMDLHLSYCGDFGLTKGDILATPPSPTTDGYTKHLLEVAYSGSALHAATAILPCSWGYSEIGKALFALGLPKNAPLYSRWIEMYNSDEFAELAGWLRSFIDREVRDMPAKVRSSLEEIFLKSSEHEYRFWDAAYRLEEW